MADKITGGDLFRLWRVSEVHLPRIADVFYDAGRVLDSGATGDASAMADLVAVEWGWLRDELLSMYAHVGTTVLTAADGLRRATEAFVDADLASGEALSRYLADDTNHDPNSPASNPPATGADDHPGQPVRPGSSRDDGTLGRGGH